MVRRSLGNPIGLRALELQQRYYDPQIGRFLSVDPVSTDTNTGANFNSYWYASNNPYRFKDPDGRQADDNYISRVNDKQQFYNLKNGFEGVIDRNFNEKGQASYEIHVFKDGNEVGTFKEGAFVTKHGKPDSAPEGFKERNLGKLKGLDNHMGAATGRLKVSPERAARLKYNAKTMRAGVAKFASHVAIVLTVAAVANEDMTPAEALGVTEMGCGTIEPCGGYVPKLDKK